MFRIRGPQISPLDVFVQRLTRLRRTHPAFYRELFDAQGAVSESRVREAVARLGLVPSPDLNANLLAAQLELDATRRIGTSRKRVGEGRVTPRG